MTKTAGVVATQVLWHPAQQERPISSPGQTAVQPSWRTSLSKSNSLKFWHVKTLLECTANARLLRSLIQLPHPCNKSFENKMWLLCKALVSHSVQGWICSSCFHSSLNTERCFTAAEVWLKPSPRTSVCSCVPDCVLKYKTAPGQVLYAELPSRVTITAWRVSGTRLQSGPTVQDATWKRQQVLHNTLLQCQARGRLQTSGVHEN